MPCGGRKKVSPYIIIVQITFSGPLGSLNSFQSFENSVPLKPVLGGLAGVAHFITGHEQIDGWMACNFRPFQQRFSHIRTMGG